MALHSSIVDIYFPDVYDDELENRAQVCKIYCKRLAVSMSIPIVCVILATAPWVAMPFMLNDS